MTTQNISSSASAPASADVRAQKRRAIGLTPNRPTAKAVPQRPPGVAEPRGCLWSMVLLVAGLIVVTLLLVSARLIDSPFGLPQFQPSAIEPIALPAAAQAPDGYRLLLVDEFTEATTFLAGHHQPEDWLFKVEMATGVYQMQVQPGRLAWSTIGATRLSGYEATATVTVAPTTPAGYAGLVGRLQDQENFYLFAIDGQGRFGVQLWQNGAMQTLMPWSGEAVGNEAGKANRLALVDNGQVLRFFVNELIRFEVANPQLPPGDLGLFTGAPGESAAQATADWLRIYALPQEALP
jgi:hypothetical protein